MTDAVTYMTDAHIAVIKHLQRAGWEVMEEVDFPPYRADVYLPNEHIVVEVDGPQHSVRADRKRDRELNRAYGLLVFHIPAALASNLSRWGTTFLMLIENAMPTREERWAKGEMKTPWL